MGNKEKENCFLPAERQRALKEAEKRERTGSGSDGIPATGSMTDVADISAPATVRADQLSRRKSQTQI